ncbi:ubiquitin-like domain-containing protein [Virgibacillus sediminis]|uniref:Ubiquitin-like domain-containing protein n=1 Tax=Virgibacillus sediminis TaxID=202260 RepID=A0ABV7A6U6_9BACI
MRLIHTLMPASKWKLVVSGIGVMALLVFAGTVVYEAAKAEVAITENGRQQTVSTHKDTVEEVLKEIGIEVGVHDEISPQLDASIKNGMEIDYITAKSVYLDVDGEVKEYFTTANTVEEFLKENELEFSRWDEVSHHGEEQIQDGLNINVKQAYPVTLNDGGKEKTVWTTGGSVEELLNENEIRVHDLDRVEPSFEENVMEGTSVSIVRVKQETDEVKEPLSIQTKTEYDDSLEKGKEKVISEGKKGEVLKKYEVTYENGEEVSRELVDKEVKVESIDRVVAVGTKEPQPKRKTSPNLVTLAANQKESPKEQSSSYAETEPLNNKSSNNASKQKASGKSYQMTASAYTAACDGCSGYTATGINLKENPDRRVVAVDPNVIPLGTKVWVEGYGEAIASDTGGHIVGNRIDIHVPSKSEAYAWGKRTVEVKVVN